LALASNHDTDARQDFISSLRRYVLNDMAGMMKQRYTDEIAPRAKKQSGHLPKTGSDIHKALAAVLMIYAATLVAVITGLIY